MKMIKERIKQFVYKYKCPECSRQFTELLDKGTFFCDCLGGELPSRLNREELDCEKITTEDFGCNRCGHQTCRCGMSSKEIDKMIEDERRGDKKNDKYGKIAGCMRCHHEWQYVGYIGICDWCGADGKSLEV